MRRPLGLFAVGCLLAAVVLGTFVLGNRGRRVEAGVYVRTFEGSEHPVDVALTRGDGQAYAALANDPALSHPDVFVDGAPEEAYRAQRPLLPYLTWALSFGQGPLVRWSLPALSVLAAGFLLWTAAHLIRSYGGDPRWALALLLIPTSITAVAWMIPEVLALALAVAALWCLERDPPRPGVAAALLAAAALSRETMLLVPAALGLHALLDRRPRRRRETLLPVVVPFIVWGGWVVVVRARLGEWPWTANHGRLALPFQGIAGGDWHDPAVVIGIVAVALCVGYGLAVTRRRQLRLIIVVYALFATIMGPDIFIRWDGFTRPLLPLFAVTVLAMSEHVPGVVSRLREAPA